MTNELRVLYPAPCLYVGLVAAQGRNIQTFHAPPEAPRTSGGPSRPRGFRHPSCPGEEERERERERVETLNALTQAVDNLPLDTLPAAQEAAMRLVRRVAARTPETWWHLDRHHGLGDIRSTVRMRSPTSPVSSDSGDSHRRRRMLAVHSKTL